MWQSRANPSAFYFGWEDQNTTGSDDDFDDLLTFVTGIQCSGSGEPCDTGQEGVCANGTEQCRDGAVACIPTQAPGDETCNAVDDDCDGETDEGDLCAGTDICVRGTCVPPCSGVEFPCPSGQVCDSASGACIDAQCAGVECTGGTVCIAGDCVGPCDGVACPWGTACRQGVCVDVCEGLQCDAGESCQVVEPDGSGEPVGVCGSCGCKGCPSGESCVESVCIEDACSTVSCMPGFRCDGGDCIDNCEGATCPAGQSCDAGACSDDPNAGDGSAGSGNGSGANGNGGSFTVDTGGTGNGTAGSAGSGNGADGSGTGTGTGTEASGCGCTVPGGPGGAPLAALGLLVGAGILVGRRRRDRA